MAYHLLCVAAVTLLALFVFGAAAAFGIAHAIA